MKTEERSRYTVWMEDTVWQRVQEHYKSDACSTQNEFIAKAIEGRRWKLTDAKTALQ